MHIYIYIYIYIYICNHTCSRLSQQKLCGNSCTWAHDFTKEPKNAKQASQGA